MPYWDIVQRSFTIAWRHRYLWLIAFFSGEAGGSFSFNYSQRSNQPVTQEQVSTWINDHAGLLLTLAILWLVLVVVFFILAAICEGATVRASAEHDAERPFGLRLAWTMGLHTMWAIARFRLLLLLLYVPLLVLIVAWVVGLVVALVNQSAGAVLALALTGLLVLLVFIVYAIYLFFIDRFGTRSIVLEERKAIPAIARAHRLLFKRFGRSLLVWLIAVAVGIAVGIVLLFFTVLVALPFVIALAATASTGSGAFWVLLAIAAMILVPIFFVVYGFLGAQGSTYWTLAFRRLDVDYAPAFLAAEGQPPRPPSAAPSAPPAPAQ